MTTSSGTRAGTVWQVVFSCNVREERDAFQVLSTSDLVAEDQYCRDRQRGEETNNQQMEKQLQPATGTAKGNQSLPCSEILYTKSARMSVS